MWWNFIGRSGEEITRAREDWMSTARFGDVHGYAGDRLRAPEAPRPSAEGAGARALRQGDGVRGR